MIYDEYLGCKIMVLDYKDKIKLIWLILKTKGFSEDYTIMELLKDEF